MPRSHVLPVTLIVFLLTACGGSNSTPTTSAPITSPPTTPTPSAAVFTSTPNTQASEGTPYSYQLAATGTGVTFALTSGPTGATLSGSTLAWTPTAQQSRTPNSFTVAANVSGASSTPQSWTVTPTGTIRISRVDTYWNESGSTSQPFDWSSAVSIVAALVPQANGSFQSLSGTAGANGTFTIPNVPAGYFWLRLGPRDTYWTSSSTFDVGSDIFVPAGNLVAPTVSTTNINFSFTALESTAARSLLQFSTLEGPFPPYLVAVDPGSTTSAGGLAVNGNLDFSSVKHGFARQYEPVTFGNANAYVLGPAVTLSNLSLTSGTTNTISEALDPTVPTSTNLSVKGSAWVPLFGRIGPAAATTTGGGFYLSVLPYVTADTPNVSSSNPIDLLATNISLSAALTPSCSNNPPLTVDVTATAVPYSDPYPAAWRRIFRVCQSASVTIPMPDGSTQGVILTNTQTTVPPTAAVSPLISAVQNPKINGADLFTAATVSLSAGVTLSWDPPSTGAPFGYTIAILSATTQPSGGIQYVATAALSTAKNTVTVPPDLLASGKTYLLIITSLADGKANMETSPHRSVLPAASAQLVSASVTIQ